MSWPNWGNALLPPLSGLTHTALALGTRAPHCLPSQDFLKPMVTGLLSDGFCYHDRDHDLLRLGS